MTALHSVTDFRDTARRRMFSCSLAWFQSECLNFDDEDRIVKLRRETPPSRARSAERSVRYLVDVATEFLEFADLRRDLERLGGIETPSGFEFASQRARNMAATVVSQRWGTEAIVPRELSLRELSVPAGQLSASAGQREPPPLRVPRVLLVSLGEQNTLCWYQFLCDRDLSAQLSCDGLQCSAALKSFQPNVLLIDESLLWGPREMARPTEYPPMRVALLSDDGWPRRSSLRTPSGGNLPAATEPAEFLDLLRDTFYLD
jgi:hypothetical protein